MGRGHNIGFVEVFYVSANFLFCLIYSGFIRFDAFSFTSTSISTSWMLNLLSSIARRRADFTREL